jgi:hypothetical protein
MTRDRDARQILHDLGVKADERGLESLTPEERTILVPWVARGVIGNGGFRYFFEGNLDLAEVARAFRELGCHQVGEACERVLSAFSAGRPTDLARVDWDRFLADEDVVYELKWEGLLSAIASHINENREAFGKHRAALKWH